MTSSPTFIASTPQQPVAGWLSSSEFHILDVICNTFFPSLEPPPGSAATQAAYYRRSASDLHVAMHMAEMLAGESAEKHAQLHQLLTFFASPVGGLLLVGQPKPFVELSLEQREKYLLAMANSSLGLLRQGYQVLKRLTGFIFFSALDEQGNNPNWEVMDYTLPALSPQDTGSPIKPLVIKEDTMLTCDAVVVGSGAGGGVVAGELALAGKDVIVLEMGDYYSEADYPLQESKAMLALYLNRGLLTSKDLGVLVLAGSTLGGGTVVNWTTSFRTPAPVLDEWAYLSGLTYFTGNELQDSFNSVEQRIHVNRENSEHNPQNQKLFDGCRALGYHADSLRRNAVGCEQRCGTCGFGCRYGCKQSTLKTYLQDAHDHGARIITRCRADKVLINNGRATGVQATVTDAETGKTYTLTVHARAVIVAAGAICSPALLLRSGLENPHIGRHLKLHPVAIVAGAYPDKVRPWEGVIQSAYSDEFGYLNGNYGYKLEVPPTHPGLIALAFPWIAAREFRDQMTRAAHLATFIVLTRDKGEGTVKIDRTGQPIINYVTSVFDRRHLMHGMQRAARIHIAAGATEVSTIQNKRTQLLRPEVGKVSERQWNEFDRQLERHGMGVNRLIIFSAHQMGTCRMGANPAQSVLDEHCQVHGVKGLFTCDGSVFPAASGVNPMLTIMALAHRAAQYIKTTL
jgi:choline dehydrogenase-like flavoprotein